MYQNVILQFHYAVFQIINIHHNNFILTDLFVFNNNKKKSLIILKVYTSNITLISQLGTK